MDYNKPEDEKLNEFMNGLPNMISNEDKFIDLLSQNEIGDLKSRYMDKVEDLFEDAMRRHVFLYNL